MSLILRQLELTRKQSIVAITTTHLEARHGNLYASAFPQLFHGLD